MSKQSQFTPKTLQSDLGKLIPPVVQLTEELAAARSLPYALLGFAQPDDSGNMQMYLATISNDEGTLQTILAAFAALLVSKGYTVTPPPMIVKP